MIRIGKTKDNRFIFECAKCGHLQFYRAPYLPRCPMCLFRDKRSETINWRWHKRAVGYSRLIPNDLRDKAIRSLYVAKQKHGVQFTKTKTFAGLKITVASIPPRLPIADLDEF